MGAPKHKWTAKETGALVAGIAKHGAGKWTAILKDPQFADILAARTNIDLKDKWRNLSVSASSQGSRYKFKSPKLKRLPASPVANSNASSSLPSAQGATADVAMDKWRNMNVSPSSQGSRDKLKSPKLKGLPAPQVANSNASSSLPAAQGATADVAMDKWRNMSVSASSQGSRDRFKSPKLKGRPAHPVANANASSSLPAARGATADVAMDPSEGPVEGKTTSGYNDLIFEAISTSKEPNGSDISAIISVLEQRTEVPQNFRRVLSSKLRRFVKQGKLEKVQNSYKIKKNGASGQKVPTTPKPKDNQHVKQSQTPPARTLEDEIKEEAAEHTAQLIVEAENKSFLASEAVKKAEQFEKMVEEAEAVHLFAMELLERTTRGEVVRTN